jgi:hypothetical protein
MLLLFPRDPLTPNKPDEHFAREASAASKAGVPYALIDDGLLSSRPLEALRSVPAGSRDIVYRGWMISSESYLALEENLNENDSFLRTTHAAYKSAHELPGWIDIFSSLTAKTRFTKGTDEAAFGDALREFASQPLIIKDYVKSLKHYWREATYIPDASDSASALRVIDNFITRRGEDLVGGLVFREFENYTGHEVRSWWVEGNCVLVTPHPDTPESGVPVIDVGFLDPFVKELGSPFVSVDLALSKKGWRVVEVGDGQVSDLPASTNPEPLMRALELR